MKRPATAMNPVNNNSLEFSQSRNKTLRDQLEESIKLEMSKLAEQRKTESPKLSPHEMAQQYSQPVR
jgi:hypothetical protein